MNNNINNKKISSQLGLVIIAICGVILLISMVSTLKKYTNYDDQCLYSNNC